MYLHIPPALRHRRFFYLWLGQLISVAGTQMQIWALFWHIRNLTDQPIVDIGAADRAGDRSLSVGGGRSATAATCCS
jgi:hypothetical protein